MPPIGAMAKRTDPSVKIALGAELVWQLTGGNMSSPQTAELNAKQRAPTIGKWVTITQAEAVGYSALLSLIDRSPWFLIGGVFAWTGMAIKYRYAIKSGLGSSAPPTERY